MKYLRSIIFYDPVGGSRLCLALHWILNLLFLGLWSLAIGIVSLWFGKVNYGLELFFSYFQYTGLFLLNVLPVFLLALALLLIFNRMWPAVFGSGLLMTVLALINYFKLMFRNDPLLATDVKYLLEAAQISSRYHVVITPVIFAVFAVIICASVFAFFFLKARFRRALPRISAALLLLAACVGLWFGAYASEEVYHFTDNLGVSFESGLQMNQWNETDKYCCRGFLYPLFHSLTRLKSSRPDGYTTQQAEDFLAEYDTASIPEDKKVNFISIMLEAYYDFSAYDSIVFDTDPYAFYHQLQSESYTGELVTNIFAGGTIDTERCYITAGTEMYDYRGSADSYAKYFAANGYHTEFCHPGYGWFYNRQNVMEYLGFDTVHFFEGRYQMPEGVGIMRDDLFFPDLLTLYDEAKAAETPYFNFSVTYQNHGPYAVDYLYDTENIYVPQGDLSDESYNILNNYFWGIRLTDNSLQELVNTLRADPEPVVLVLFGDHKPWLGDNSTVYAELGIDLSRTTEDSFYNYYNTQYLIWANDAAREVLGNDVAGDGGSFSPCFLMMKLFDLCGYEGDAYLQQLRALYDAGVDVVNISGRCRENGVLTETLSDTAAEALRRVRYLEYYRMKEG